MQSLIPGFWGEISLSLQGKQRKPSVSKDSGLQLVFLLLFFILLALGPFYWQKLWNKLAQCLLKRKTRKRKTTLSRLNLNHYIARYVQFCVWVCQLHIDSEDSAEKMALFPVGEFCYDNIFRLKTAKSMWCVCFGLKRLGRVQFYTYRVFSLFCTYFSSLKLNFWTNNYLSSWTLVLSFCYLRRC